MMFLELIIWSLLISIGVSDAQRHLIPNHYVFGLIVLVVLQLTFDSSVMWLEHVKGFGATFGICIVLYALRLMAGGDVKLLAVVGLWLGAGDMWQSTAYIILAGGVVSVFYLAFYLASSPITLTEHARYYTIQKATPGWKAKQPLVIPFAPAIVIGLACYFYIH